MDKEVVVHVLSGILLSYKKEHFFEAVLIRWMNLEPIIQSEVWKRQISYIYIYIWNLER